MCAWAESTMHYALSRRKAWQGTIKFLWHVVDHVPRYEAHWRLSQFFTKLVDWFVVLFLYKGANTKQKKELSENSLKVELHCKVEPYNASRHAGSIYMMFSKGSSTYLLMGKHCKCMASLKTSNFNSKEWIKILLPRNFQVQSILCAHMKIVPWTASQSLKHYFLSSV